MKTRLTTDDVFASEDRQAAVSRTPSGYVDLMVPVGKGVSAQVRMLQTEACELATKLVSQCDEVTADLGSGAKLAPMPTPVLGSWVMVTGNPFGEGLSLQGPYITEEDAEEAATGLSEDAWVVEIARHVSESEGEATTVNEALENLVAEIEATGWHDGMTPTALGESFKGHAGQLTRIKAALAEKVVTKEQRQSILRHMKGVAMRELSTVAAEVLLDAKAMGADEEETETLDRPVNPTVVTPEQLYESAGKVLGTPKQAQGELFAGTPPAPAGENRFTAEAPKPKREKKPKAEAKAPETAPAATDGGWLTF